MGLPVPIAEVLVAEHVHRKIEGDVLFVGRQTIHLDQQSLERLLARYGVTIPSGFVYEYDTETRGASGRRLITDRCFMRSLGLEKVRFLDVTDYEGADVVHDLGYPVPDSLLEGFDFIYNGGCLDNMFNPGVAMMNFSKMLRPNGRIVCFESASSWNSPYLMYSPGWFRDYYVTNGFSDSKVYVGSFYDGDAFMSGPWDWFYVNLMGKRATWQETNGPSPAARETNHVVLVSVAEKGLRSTTDQQPIQLQYRVGKGLAEKYAANAEAMKSSSRPVVLGQAGQNYDLYLTPLGKIGDGIHPRPIKRQMYMAVRRFLRAMKVILRILLGKSVV